MRLIVVLQYLILFACTWGEEHSFNGTVYYNSTSNTYTVTLGVIDCTNGVACGYFDDALNRTGMGVLEIQTQKPGQNSKITDYNRMYGAGYLEGYLSCYEIYWGYYAGWMNLKPSLEPYMSQLQNWSATQKEWINENIAKYADSDPLWQYVELLTGQFYGVKDGYNAAIQELDTGLPPLDEFAFDFINANEEWPDVVQAINESTRVDWFAFKTSKQALNHRLKSGHCSGLIKVTPELDDIIFSHSTWFQYWWMNRVYKIYSFKLDMDIPTSKMVMSSYPGALSSIDDWYVMDSGMATMETTNDIANSSLYDLVVPQSLYTWQRARIANALTSNGYDWTRAFARYNSGTYNNQWMALTYSMFVPGQSLPDGLLWICEQIPGNVTFLDVTDVLERGYWGSYNVPAIEYTYEVSGNAALAAQYGPTLSYDLAPRARLFRKMANQCNNITTAQKFMRYNDYKNDPLENMDPGWAIMSRFDLESDGPSPSGGYDTKLSNFAMLQSLSSWVQAGPTHDNVPPFSWDQFPDIVHTGMPLTYDFDWHVIKPQLN